MPWKECHKMDERVRFVSRHLEGESISELCREFGISRVTGHKLVAWSGIEPLTRGFSIHVASICPMFMRVVAVFCVTCDIPCYRKTTLF